MKGGFALTGRRLFVGSYDHHLYALNARTGKLIWRGSAQERLGSRGTFYSTSAAAYGRVYIGSTDGKVYSFGATTGELRWSQSTGGYVYASPAVWKERILIGAYSGKFFCLDAATGDVRWTFTANGPISVRRSARQCPPSASAIDRTYVPDETRSSRRAMPSA